MVVVDIGKGEEGECWWVFLLWFLLWFWRLSGVGCVLGFCLWFLWFDVWLFVFFLIILDFCIVFGLLVFVKIGLLRFVMFFGDMGMGEVGECLGLFYIWVEFFFWFFEFLWDLVLWCFWLLWCLLVVFLWLFCVLWVVFKVVVVFRLWM